MKTIVIDSEATIEVKMNTSSNNLKAAAAEISKALNDLNTGKISLGQAKVISKMGSDIIRGEMSAAMLDNQIVRLQKKQEIGSLKH